MTLFELMAKISLDTSEYESGLSSASSKTHSFGSAISGGIGKVVKAAGVALAGATTAVAAFGVSSVKTGMDFDQSMSQVAATMGKTVDEIQDLRDFAQEMGSTTSFSAKQAADALNYMALAGYDSEKSMEMLPNVLNLAAAGGMELATASDMVTDASSALGLQTEETTAMVDQMAKASSKSNTSVEQLGQAMLTVGGTAKSLKGGTVELATALGILADNGVKGAEGGTALRNILTTIQGSKFEKTFGEMGISAYDAQGNLRSLQDVFMDMNTAMEGMTTEEKTNLINNTFNARDLKNVNALLGTNAKRWDELTAAIGDSEGAAKEMADTQLDNLAGDITLFKSALEGAQIAISDNLTPSLRDFVKTGSDGLSKFTELLKGGDFAGAMESIGNTIGQIATQVVSKIPALVSAGGQLLKGIGQGIASQAPSLFQNVTVMAISGMRTVADAIVKNAPIIAEKIPEVLQSVVARFESVSSAMLTVGVDMITQLGQGLAQGIPSLLENVLPMILQFTEFLRANAGLLIDAGLEFITNFAQGIINSIPVLIEYIPEIITNIAGIINDNAPKVLSAGINIVKNLVSGIIKAIPVIVSNLPKIISAIWNVFTATNWINIGTTIINGIVGGVKALANYLPDALRNIGSSAMDFLKSIQWGSLGSSIMNSIVTGVKAIGSNLPSALGSIGRAAINMFKSINWAGVGKTVITLLSGAIKGAGKLIITGLKTIGKTAINGFKSVNWKGVGKSVITFLANAIKGAGKLVWNGLKNIGKTAVEKFKSIKWLDLGKNIITGIVSGLSSVGHKINDFLLGLAKKALGAVKSFFGIKSPSRVMRDEVGKRIAEGWALGIKKGGLEVQRAMDDLNDIAMSNLPEYDIGFAQPTSLPRIATPSEEPYATIDVPTDPSETGSKIINVNTYVTVNGAEEPEDWAERLVRGIRQQVRMA